MVKHVIVISLFEMKSKYENEKYIFRLMKNVLVERKLTN